MIILYRIVFYVKICAYSYYIFYVIRFENISNSNYIRAKEGLYDENEL